MDVDYEMIASSQVCRICLKPVEEGQSIYDGDPSYCDMLRDLTGCQVHPIDMLPNVLCDFCAESLNNLSQFIQLCRDSEARIQRIVEEGSQIDIKMEPIVKEKSDEVKIERYEKSSDGESFGEGGEEGGEEEEEKGEEGEEEKEEVKAEVKREAAKASKYSSRKSKRHIKCKVCDLLVISKSALTIHLRTHTGEKPYSCDLCEKSFAQKGSIVQHMERVHLKCKVFRFTCEICGKQTNCRNDLIIHFRVHTREKPHKCTICSVGFAQMGTLQHHMRLHSGLKPFSCDICGKSFIANTSLSRHMTSHSDERQFKCHMCDKSFKAKSSMKQHFLLHSAEMPYTCSHCGKLSRTASNLRLHMKAMHSELSGNCEKCNKNFPNLPEHVKIHTGERPYACSYCDKKFAQKRSWTHHENKHKNASRFICPVEKCKKGFPDSYKLDYHKIKCHSEKAPFPCELCPKKFYRCSDLTKHTKKCVAKLKHPEKDAISKEKKIKKESD